MAHLSDLDCNIDQHHIMTMITILTLLDQYSQASLEASVRVTSQQRALRGTTFVIDMDGNQVQIPPGAGIVILDGNDSGVFAGLCAVVKSGQAVVGLVKIKELNQESCSVAYICIAGRGDR
jgi:ABC-type phosphate transport system auxiliary subunit